MYTLVSLLSLAGYVLAEDFSGFQGGGSPNGDWQMGPSGDSSDGSSSGFSTVASSAYAVASTSAASYAVSSAVDEVASSATSSAAYSASTGSSSSNSSADYSSVESSVAASSTGTSRTSAPDGALTVGSSGDYSTVQDAVDALDTSTTTEQSIFIDEGTYNEQVVIPELASSLIIYGYTTDTSSYSGNGATITYDLSQASGDYDDDETGTVRVQSDYVKIYNVNIANSYGEGSQAIALSAYGDYFGCYGCQLTGYQDTLLAEQGYQVYGKCYIEGATDFIFGQEGIVWIDSSDIGVSADGTITASGRSSDDDGYYVINESTVDYSTSSSASSGGTYLGRPWQDYARVIFQNTVLSDVVNSAGWEVWNTDDERTDYVTFAEYDNSGDGASGTRASFATTLSSALSITDVLGSDYSDWVDTSYIAA
ncbi:MAG: hypothetical protein M1834_002908 [Cirrosporium novae-zelandiae]|nr:MAG: hypothetical protein M1834_002908 [Cirrosporium novae-zelandiae]